MTSSVSPDLLGGACAQVFENLELPYGENLGRLPPIVMFGELVDPRQCLPFGRNRIYLRLAQRGEHINKGVSAKCCGFLQQTTFLMPKHDSFMKSKCDQVSKLPKTNFGAPALQPGQLPPWPPSGPAGSWRRPRRQLAALEGRSAAMRVWEI